MIFVFIAGTYTPITVLTLPPAQAQVIVIAAWIAATAGVLVTVFWINAPRWVTAGCYLAAGWIAVMALPRLWNGLGPARFSLLATGAALYTVGAVVYARKRPDPAPETFGYHEVFHALVIAAVTCHYVLSRPWCERDPHPGSAILRRPRGPEDRGRGWADRAHHRPPAPCPSRTPTRATRGR